MIYINKVFKPGTLSLTATESINTGIQIKIEPKIDIAIIQKLFLDYSIIDRSNKYHIKIKNTIISIYENKKDSNI